MYREAGTGQRPLKKRQRSAFRRGDRWTAQKIAGEGDGINGHICHLNAFLKGGISATGGDVPPGNFDVPSTVDVAVFPCQGRKLFDSPRPAPSSDNFVWNFLLSD